MHFPISFFDKTPTGRILNRVGKDIETVDGQLVRSLEMWMHCLFRVVFSILSICVASPWYLIVLPFFAYIYFKVNTKKTKPEENFVEFFALGRKFAIQGSFLLKNILKSKISEFQ